jgi:hypothetical protein
VDRCLWSSCKSNPDDIEAVVALAMPTSDSSYSWCGCLFGSSSSSQFAEDEGTHRGYRNSKRQRDHEQDIGIDKDKDKDKDEDKDKEKEKQNQKSPPPKASSSSPFSFRSFYTSSTPKSQDPPPDDSWETERDEFDYNSSYPDSASDGNDSKHSPGRPSAPYFALPTSHSPSKYGTKNGGNVISGSREKQNQQQRMQQQRRRSRKDLVIAEGLDMLAELQVDSLQDCGTCVALCMMIIISCTD